MVRSPAWAKTAATCQGSHAFSLRRAPLAWARCHLAQTRALRLSEISSTNLAWFCKSRLGETDSLRREHQFLVTIFPATGTHTNPNQYTKAFHAFIESYQPYNRKITARQTENQNTRVSPSFPYLEGASQKTRILKQWTPQLWDSLMS